MNRTLEVGKSLWEAACSALSAIVTAGLLMLFLYWLIIQPAALSLNEEGLSLNYTAARGTLIYIENPLNPPNSTVQVEVRAELVGVSTMNKYLLSSRDSRDMFVLDDPNVRPAYIRVGYPMYAVYIPAYVKPGVYLYQAEAKYRLNFFREEKVKLPTITVTVE